MDGTRTRKPSTYLMSWLILIINLARHSLHRLITKSNALSLKYTGLYSVLEHICADCLLLVYRSCRWQYPLEVPMSVPPVVSQLGGGRDGVGRGVLRGGAVRRLRRPRRHGLHTRRGRASARSAEGDAHWSATARRLHVHVRGTRRVSLPGRGEQTLQLGEIPRAVSGQRVVFHTMS